MKGLISLAVVVAFFVTIPQCLGQSQDSSQLLTEQQLVQMFQLAMAPPTIASVPVSNLLQRGRERPPKEGTEEICHYKKILKHCFIDGEFRGGGQRTVQESKVQGHLVHEPLGDCLIEDANTNITDCPNHCICNKDLNFLFLE